MLLRREVDRGGSEGPTACRLRFAYGSRITECSARFIYASWVKLCTLYSSQKHQSSGSRLGCSHRDAPFRITVLLVEKTPCCTCRLGVHIRQFHSMLLSQFFLLGQHDSYHFLVYTVFSNGVLPPSLLVLASWNSKKMSLMTLPAEQLHLGQKA